MEGINKLSLPSTALTLDHIRDVATQREGEGEHCARRARSLHAATHGLYDALLRSLKLRSYTARQRLARNTTAYPSGN